MFDCAPGSAGRKHMVYTFVAMLFYLLATYISVHAIRQNPSISWKYVWALLPMLPALYVPFSVVSFLRGIDELQRKIQLDALAFAFATSAVLTLSYGFLQNAGLPELSWIWVWPVMSLCWIVGLAVARWRYR
jgi:hypothetical protein